MIRSFRVNFNANNSKDPSSLKSKSYIVFKNVTPSRMSVTFFPESFISLNCDEYLGRPVTAFYMWINNPASPFSPPKDMEDGVCTEMGSNETYIKTSTLQMAFPQAKIPENRGFILDPGFEVCLQVNWNSEEVSPFNITGSLVFQTVSF